MKSILALVAAFLIGLFIWLLYMGMLVKPVVDEVIAGPYNLMYKKFDGDYQMSGMFLNNFALLLKDQGIRSDRTFNLYFENPREAESNMLRSIAGAIISDSDLEKSRAVKEKFYANTFAEQPCLRAVFPYRSRISSLFGVLKVYAVLEKYRADKNYPKNPIMEIYDEATHRIVYLMPIEKRENLVKKYFHMTEAAAVVPVSGVAAPVSPAAGQ